VLAASLEPRAAAAGPPPEPAAVARPAYRLLRQDEDWSAFALGNPAGPRDPWDPLKYIPLGDRAWVSFGGSQRVRLERWSDFGFGAPPNDHDTFLLGRIYAHADLHLGEATRVFVEAKSALSTKRDLPGGKRPMDVDTIDLQQGFAELRGTPIDDVELRIRLGRQAFSYGRQRLVSPLPWPNSLRSWDGASAQLRRGNWSVDGIWSLFDHQRKYAFNDPDQRVQFFGLYATGSPLDGPAILDLYALGRTSNHDEVWNGTRGHDDRYTLGARLDTPLAPGFLHLETEAAAQLGRVGNDDVCAFMAALELTARAANWWSAPRLSAGLDYASGDRSPGGAVQTFNQLYPLAHAFLGYMDFVGRQNVFATHLTLRLSPVPRLEIELSGHYFERAQRQDAFYNAGGAVVRPGGPGTPRQLGAELDVVARYGLGRHIKGEVGYGHFFPGRFIRATGSDAAMDFIYLQLGYTF